MQAIILAGGLGTRLRSVVADVPKPMAPIKHQPFLAYLFNYLKQQGFQQLILSVYYQHEKIQHYFGSNYQGINLEYVIEPEPLGTGGAILFALSKINHSQPVFVINGDTFVKLNYNAMYQKHSQNNAKLTIALCPRTDCSRYGEVKIKEDKIISFEHLGKAQPGLINAGIYLLNHEIFNDFVPSQKFSFEKDFLYPKVATLQPHYFVSENYFIDIGVPADYARAQIELADNLT